MPKSLGISLYCDHKWRSNNLANLLSHAGVGVPCQRVKQSITQIAKGVQENMEKHDGNYIPPGLHRQKRLHFSLDNIDAKVDTPDGQNSFHATAMAVYQRQPSAEDTTDVVVKYIAPTLNRSARSLKDVPTTIVPLVNSTISGSPKPPTSPHYLDFKMGKNADQLRRAEVEDLAWLLVRYFHHNALQSEDAEESEHVLQPIPVWAVYNSLTCASHSSVDESVESYKLDKVHGFPLINSPVHEWTTLITALLQLHNLNQLMRENDRSHNSEPILVWLDMDLYKRVCKLSFLDHQFQDNIIASPGPFHIVLCVLRCLGEQLKAVVWMLHGQKLVSTVV